MVLANLCVCYLVTSQNEEAEELLRKLEKEEERKVMPPFPENIFFKNYFDHETVFVQCLENPQAKFFHLSIVNLVIGTLYCAKVPQPFPFRCSLFSWSRP